MKTKNGYATATMDDLRSSVGLARMGVRVDLQVLEKKLRAEVEQLGASVSSSVENLQSMDRLTIRQQMEDYRFFASLCSVLRNDLTKLSLLVESRTLRGRWRRLVVFVTGGDR